MAFIKVDFTAELLQWTALQSVPNKLAPVCSHVCAWVCVLQ